MKPIHLAFVVAQRLRAVWRRAFNVKAHGVKAMVLREDSVLLVRHSYQSQDTYMLPGGGIDRGETTIAAAIREVREETGCTLINVRVHGVFISTAEGWSNHITVVVGETADDPQADERELLEASFFPLDALPANTSPASLRRIIEVRDGLAPAAGW